MSKSSDLHLLLSEERRWRQQVNSPMTQKEEEDFRILYVRNRLPHQKENPPIPGINQGQRADKNQ